MLDKLNLTIAAIEARGRHPRLTLCLGKLMALRDLANIYTYGILVTQIELTLSELDEILQDLTP